MMKSGFFSRKDEVVISTMTALVVIGLLHLGFTSWMNGREHTMFQKSIPSKK